MSDITDQFLRAFRDFETDGLPSSGLHEVVKSDVRAIGPLIDQALGFAGLAALVSVVKDTRAALDGDLAHAADVVALVYGDAAGGNNDLYVKVGASGAGSWTLTGALHSLLFSAGALAAYRKVADIGEREAIPMDERSYGLRVYVVDPGRVFEWTAGAGTGGDADWVGLMNQSELINLGNATGSLPESQVTGLVTDLANLGATISTRFSGTLAERGSLSGAALVNGQRYYVTDISPPREFVRVTSGNEDPAGTIVGSDQWFGMYTPPEIKNLGIDFTGTLPAARVEGLVTAYANMVAAGAVRIAGFRATALSGGPSPTVRFDWDTTGPMPDRFVLSCEGTSLALSGTARTFTWRDLSVTTGLGTVGNSLSDSSDVADRYSQVLAASLGVDLVSVARYSSDARQVYRLGAKALTLTIAANTLPAYGDPAADVTALNGLAPSADATVNPASFLNTGDAGVVSGMTATGWIGATPVSITISNGAAIDYKIVQTRPGAPALVLDGPAQFVPDVAFQFVDRTVIAWLGNNYFFSGVPNTYGDHTNPQLWVDLALIVQFLQERGNRVILLPIIPGNDYTTGTGNAYDAMLAANARTESLYPDLYAPGLLEWLQAAGGGSGLYVPDSLHRTGDALHLNTAGDAAVADFIADFMASQTLPPALAIGLVAAMRADASFLAPSTDTAVCAIAA
jgi:hypothetical protein